MTNSSDRGRAPSGRAASLEAMGAVLCAMFTPEGTRKGLELKLRPTDIVIAPFTKSGTTWLQQMAHTLRTHGDMDFDDISRVCPWIEASTDLGLDLDAEQKAEPRVFKTHLDAHRVPSGGRYIVACRDPKDVAWSLYKFMEGWTLEPGAVSLDDFVRGAFIARDSAPGDGGQGYWTHLRSWWPRRNDPDVLFMAYEHMSADLPRTIRRVAAFMGIALDDELLAITGEHASFAFMRAHNDRFDDRLMRERSVAVAGLPADSDSSKVRRGAVGESRQQLGPEVVALLDAIWRERITAELGFEDYAAMIATID